MSVPASVGRRLRLSRRGALLVVGALTAAAGCTTDAPPQEGRRDRVGGTPEPTTQEDPDVTVATEALTAQREMQALVAAVVARHPALGERLSGITSAHAAHVAMLDGAVPSSPSPSSSASPTAAPGDTPGGSPGPSQPQVPRNPERALAALVTAERGLATTTKRLAFRAQSGAFARLLGSMAASVAQHAHDLATSTGRAGR